jgi:methylated-DNA-protein-cysteine methyltransferase related protein
MMNLDSTTNDFFERVYEIVLRIPKGYVTTYGHIARALGSAQSSRMVGWAMNAVPQHARRNEIPAHRVINRNGELTGKMHFETPTMMEELLRAEGVTFVGEAVDMKKHLWTPDELQDADSNKRKKDKQIQSGLFE